MIKDRRLPGLLSMLIAAALFAAGCNIPASLNDNGSDLSSTDISSEEISETTVSPTPTPSPTPSPSPTPTPPPEHINVSFIGDCTLADALAWSGSPGSFDAVYNAQGYEYFFQNCRETLMEDDMTLANFEGTITDATSHLVKEFVFGAPFEYTQILTYGSVEAVNLANNHSWDYYDQGLQDTRDAMDEVGIAWSDASNTAIFEVRGIKIGMFGIDLVSGDSASTAYPLIQALQDAGCNIIIASCHWGVERDYLPRDSQVWCGHDLIDHGVDIVVGAHPHRLQPIERYNGKYIIYSLSNFCFGGNTGLSDPDSVIIQCEFIMDATNTYCEDMILKAIPYCQTSTRPGNDYCPRPYEWGTDDYYRVLDRLQWTNEDE